MQSSIAFDPVSPLFYNSNSQTTIIYNHTHFLLYARPRNITKELKNNANLIDRNSNLSWYIYERVRLLHWFCYIYVLSWVLCDSLYMLDWSSGSYLISDNSNNHTTTKKVKKGNNLVDVIVIGFQSVICIYK